MWKLWSDWGTVLNTFVEYFCGRKYCSVLFFLIFVTVYFTFDRVIWISEFHWILNFGLSMFYRSDQILNFWASCFTLLTVVMTCSSFCYYVLPFFKTWKPNHLKRFYCQDNIKRRPVLAQVENSFLKFFYSVFFNCVARMVWTR